MTDITSQTGFSAEEISAFIDGDLSGARTSEIERRLRRDPTLRQHLEQHLAIEDGLSALGGGKMGDPLPESLEKTTRQLQSSLERGDGRPGRLAASLSGWRQGWMLVAGCALGWAVTTYVATPDPVAVPANGILGLVDEATEVHRSITLAPGFAADIATVDFAALAALFSDKLEVPDAAYQGFQLSKVDVVATDTGPALAYLYRDANGLAISIMIADSDGEHLSQVLGADSVTTYSDMSVAVGRQGDNAVTVTGPLPEGRIREIARLVFSSLNT